LKREKLHAQFEKYIKHKKERMKKSILTSSLRSGFVSGGAPCSQKPTEAVSMLQYNSKGEEKGRTQATSRTFDRKVIPARNKDVEVVKRVVLDWLSVLERLVRLLSQAKSRNRSRFDEKAGTTG
jgi:hypothetical protein